MLSIPEYATLEEASQSLLPFALQPENWIGVGPEVQGTHENPAYHRRVGNLRVSATVDVLPSLDVKLRVAFRGANLSPLKAADLLETFLKGRLPMTPNTEWEVEIDSRRWIHFSRRYTGPELQA